MKGLAGEQFLRALEKHVLLRILDDKWKEHLSTMDHLRQGIRLRGYAAKNPKQEYKREAFELFSQIRCSRTIAPKSWSVSVIRRRTALSNLFFCSAIPDEYRSTR